MRLVYQGGNIFDEGGALLAEAYGNHWLSSEQLEELVKRNNFCEGLPKEVMNDTFIEQINQLDKYQRIIRNLRFIAHHIGEAYNMRDEYSQEEWDEIWDQ